MARFSWLQIGSFAAAYEDHWPGLEVEDLLVALRHLSASSGPWHAIFLTGDLVVQGNDEGFEKTERLLDRLLSEISTLSSSPVVLGVPGNHDLRRGLDDDMAARLLKFWSEDEEIRSAFWGTSSSSYRLAVEKAFTPYTLWANRSLYRHRRRGMLPGDFSAMIDGEGCKVGVVGLNTAFLDLLGENHQEGQMALGEAQMRSVWGDRPEEWLARHDATFFLTHHPPHWLDRESQRIYYDTIAGPNRFTAHLYDSQRETPRYTPGSDPVALPSPPVPALAAGQLDLDARTLRLWPNSPEGLGSLVWGLSSPSPTRLRLASMSDLTSEGISMSGPVSGEVLSLPADEPRLVVEKLEIRNFKNLEHLDLLLDRDSRLPGRWTCVAGINGAGKSSVLQALCLVLLGDRRIPELGWDRLARMRRHASGERHETEIRVWIREGKIRQSLDVRLSDSEANGLTASGPHYRRMLDLWERLARRVLSYGATRNLSDAAETRHAHLSAEMRRQMTLFDPLTQVASAEALLREPEAASPFVRLLGQLVAEIFGDELGMRTEDGRVRFTVEGEPVDPIDLPDGFRSSLAWLADLTFTWVSQNPDKAAQAKPSDIEAIVLLDEIDLHLHPSLQRSLVPKLREALPRVQWIVTTHSPLVLSCFDSAEIVALDLRVPGGVRQLDRQILGFSVEEIYRWLMHTSPTSGALEDELSKVAEGEKPPESVALLMELSPEVDEDEARARLERRKQLVAQLDKL